MAAVLLLSTGFWPALRFQCPFHAGKYRLKVPFWGRTENKLISFYVNVNLQKLINLSGPVESTVSTCEPG